MPTVILAERERGIQRTRPRPNARGNFIVLQLFATVYTLTFAPTDSHYIKWIPYRAPTAKAIGYIDDPPLDPPLVPLGPVAQTEAVPQIIGIPADQAPLIPTIETFPITQIPTAPISAPVVLPSSLPEGATFTAEAAKKPGDTFTTLIQAVVSQLFSNSLPIRGVTILADPANSGTVWTGYKNTVMVDNGFPLIAGAAKDFDIDDLSALFLIADAANQKVHVEYVL